MRLGHGQRWWWRCSDCSGTGIVGGRGYEPAIVRVVWVQRVRTLLGIEKGLGKGIVLDLQRGDLLVLVRSDRNELRLWKRIGDHMALLRAHAHQMHSWLVLVQ